VKKRVIEPTLMGVRGSARGETGIEVKKRPKGLNGSRGGLLVEGNRQKLKDPVVEQTVTA